MRGLTSITTANHVGYGPGRSPGSPGWPLSPIQVAGLRPPEEPSMSITSLSRQSGSWLVDWCLIIGNSPMVVDSFASIGVHVFSSYSFCVAVSLIASPYVCRPAAAPPAHLSHWFRISTALTTLRRGVLWFISMRSYPPLTIGTRDLTSHPMTQLDGRGLVLFPSESLAAWQ